MSVISDHETYNRFLFACLQSLCRIVCCTGGSGDNEHNELLFRCREGFLYRCGECDQIYMLVRVMYTLPEGMDPFPVDPDVSPSIIDLPEFVHPLSNTTSSVLSSTTLSSSVGFYFQIDDVFDMRLLEKGQRLWNTGEYVYWPAGNLAYKRAFMEGELTLVDY